MGGSPGLAAYQSAKFAVEGFSEVLHNEVKPFGVKVTIVEPGAFRTDWAGSSMRTVTPGPDYEQTVGAMGYRRAGFDRSAPGDPARAARILCDIVGLDEPPLRLLLGKDALELAEKSSRERAEEATRWSHLTLATAFPPGE